MQIRPIRKVISLRLAWELLLEIVLKAIWCAVVLSAVQFNILSTQWCLREWWKIPCLSTVVCLSRIFYWSDQGHTFYTQLLSIIYSASVRRTKDISFRVSSLSLKNLSESHCPTGKQCTFIFFRSNETSSMSWTYWFQCHDF